MDKLFEFNINDSTSSLSANNPSACMFQNILWFQSRHINVRLSSLIAI